MQEINIFTILGALGPRNQLRYFKCGWAVAISPEKEYQFKKPIIQSYKSNSGGTRTITRLEPEIAPRASSIAA